jgi:hypothetical protein
VTGLLGLYELDAAGTILYSSFKSENGGDRRIRDLDGVDFFSKVTQFNNVADFHRRFDTFRVASVPTETFDFTCEYPNERQMIRVLMARLSKDKVTDSFLIYIRRSPTPDFEFIAA